MTRPRENPLFPASLAANGIQGEGENTHASIYGAQHSSRERMALLLALAAMDVGRCQLARYAGMTDTPAWGAVDVADLLDAARVTLARVMMP